MLTPILSKSVKFSFRILENFSKYSVCTVLEYLSYLPFFPEPTRKKIGDTYRIAAERVLMRPSLVEGGGAMFS